MKETVALSRMIICLGCSSGGQGEQPIPDDVVLSEDPILMLDSEGKYLRGMSREGEGPAEFQGIRSVEVLPDGTLAAWGSVNRQIVFFDTLGGYLRTISHRAEYLRSRVLTNNDPSYQESLARIDDGDFNEVFPTHAALKFGQDGFLWVRRYPRPEEETTVWYVFDPKGRWVTSISIPAHLEIMDVGEHFLLAPAKTDLGVEELHLYDLQRE